MQTMQNSGLMQNQPSISPPRQQPQSFSGGGVGFVGDGGAHKAYQAQFSGSMGDWYRNNGMEPPQPNQPQTPQPAPQTPQPAAPAVTPTNAPAPGMDFLEGVRSREQRAMDRELAQVSANIKKRGLNTSAIGQRLEDTSRADLTQRVNENVSAAAFQDYQMKQKLAHETAMQNLVGSQAIQQQNNDIDQKLRGAQGMIPITTTEYQAGIDAYKKNFPQLFNQQANPQVPSIGGGGGGGGGGDDVVAAALAKIYGGSGGRTREELLGGGGGGVANVPQIGPGATPGNAVGGPDPNDPNFGYTSGPIGPNGSRTPTRTPTNQPVDNGNPTRSNTPTTSNYPTGWTPQLSGPLQNMSPITDRFRPQTPQFSGGPRPVNTSPLQANTNSLGIPGIK